MIRLSLTLISAIWLQLSNVQAQNIIWSEDFSSGIPNGWTNSSLDPVNKPNSTWEYRGSNTSPNATIGSRGLFAEGLGIINSASAANGFVIFDSDWRDNAGSENQRGQGSAPGPHAARLITSSIDLSAVSIARLAFTSYARKRNAKLLTCVSRDGGTTWPDTFSVHKNLLRDAASNNTTHNKVFFDFMANSANVKIQFLFDGRTPLVMLMENGDYFWQIDDLSISSRPQFDIGLENIKLSQIDAARFPQNAFSAVVPFAPNNNQHPRLFTTAQVANFGAASLNNVQLNYTVSDSFSAVFNQSTTNLVFPALSPSLVAATSLSQNVWSPTNSNRKGAYEIKLEVQSDSLDQFPENNLFKRNYVVSDEILSNAYVSPFGSLRKNQSVIATSGVGSYSETANQCIICNELALSQKAQVTHIGIQLGPGSQPSGDVVVSVYEKTATYPLPFGTNATPARLTSDNYGITSADIAQGFVKIPIPDITLIGKNQLYSKILCESSSYWVCAEIGNSWANPNPNQRIAVIDDQTFPQPEESSITYLPASSNGRAAGWHTLGNNYGIVTFLSPAFLPCTLSSEEMEIASRLFPNPASNEVSLFLNLKQPETIQIRIFDLSGREVWKGKSVEHQEGAHQWSVDVSSLITGSYVLECLVGPNKIVHKLNILR